MKDRPKIVVVTGAESTGKSALALYLAEHFKSPYIPEFARDYIENLGRKYNYHDVEVIARQQVRQLEEAVKMNPEYIFADTWLIITKIWFEEVFQTVPHWLEHEIRNTDIHMFLVCDTDLPWVPDKVRENGGEKRNYLQQKYIANIIHYGFEYSTVKGLNRERFHNALFYLELAGNNKPKHQ